MWEQVSTWRRCATSPIPAQSRAHTWPIPQTPQAAREFYLAKVEELGKNLQDLEGIVQQKNGQLRVVEDGKPDSPRLVIINSVGANTCWLAPVLRQKVIDENTNSSNGGGRTVETLAG